MKLYLKGNEFEVPLYSKLTPHLYEIVTPLFNDIAQTKGALSAIEEDIMQAVLGNPNLSSKVDLTKGKNAFDKLATDPELQEIIKHAYIKVRNRLLEVVNIDKTTIPKIFALTKACIDIEKLQNPELIAGIKSKVTSDFWQEQDLEGILTELEFFRSTVCRRIRIV
jgi:hypothetical protein